MGTIVISIMITQFREVAIPIPFSVIISVRKIQAKGPIVNANEITNNAIKIIENHEKRAFDTIRSFTLSFSKFLITNSFLKRREVQIHIDRNP